MLYVVCMTQSFPLKVEVKTFYSLSDYTHFIFLICKGVYIVQTFKKTYVCYQVWGTWLDFNDAGCPTR